MTLALWFRVDIVILVVVGWSEVPVPPILANRSYCCVVATVDIRAEIWCNCSLLSACLHHVRMKIAALCVFVWCPPRCCCCLSPVRFAL
ncbi:hypothetical protein TNCV_3094381 [Trichonephila clavipes]|nr:hypothetical protein TNCV_3094381 [Trichonephila clavipes]